MERIIEIKGLSVAAFIGVPDEERKQEQRLCFDLRFVALLQPKMLNDNIIATVDYAAVSQRLEQIVQEQPYRLIETVADEITETLLEEFRLRWIEVTVRKFILPNAEYVAVSLRREATAVPVQ